MLTQTRRPLPGPRYQVAPPVVDGFSPWAAILEETEPETAADGELRWVMGPDGVLLPERQSGSADTVRAARRRLAAFVGR